jgi:hypothetical protein
VKIYECTNPVCALGTPGAPGMFTGGATNGQILDFTGKPLPIVLGTGDVGEYLSQVNEGVCPNCGTKGSVSNG